MGTRSRQCGPKVPGGFAFPGARIPRSCSISRFGTIFPAIFPGFSRSSPREPPNRPRKQPQPSRVFWKMRLVEAQCAYRKHCYSETPLGSHPLLGSHSKCSELHDIISWNLWECCNCLSCICPGIQTDVQLDFRWVQEGLKFFFSVEAPKPHSGSFSSRFGLDSGGLPGCNSDFWCVTLTLTCNSDFEA